MGNPYCPRDIVRNCSPTWSQSLRRLRTIIICDSSDKTNRLRLLLAAAAFSVAAPTGAATHEYRVSVDAGMQRMQVEAVFAEPVTRISARSRDAGDYLSAVRDCSEANGNGDQRRIRIRNRRMLLPDFGITCLSYAVNLQRAAGRDRRNAALADSNIIVSPTNWLWRPEISGDDEIRVRFDLPQSVQVSVPWRAIDGQAHSFRLGNSPESSEAFAAFGQFEFRETQIGDASLRITMMLPDRKSRFDPDFESLFEWVVDTARGVSLPYGRLPNTDLSVVIVPIGNQGWGDKAVTFGRVVRDGGETVELFVNMARPIEEFYDNWTATHEFSHLLLPFIRDDHRWISEGFASYYQNVLMARTGRYTEERAWRKIWEGFERGRNSRPEMSMNEAAEARGWATIMKIYWSGAAIALMADVELRQRSGGSETLDSVLGRLQLCCVPSDRTWSGTELFRQLDALIDEPLFMPLYRRYANTAGFPDAHALLEQLGVDYARRRARLSDRAELADIRRQIMQEPQQH